MQIVHNRGRSPRAGADLAVAALLVTLVGAVVSCSSDDGAGATAISAVGDASGGGADGSAGDAGSPGPTALPELGSCGLSPIDHCPDFHGFQPLAGGPYASLLESIHDDPVDPNSAIMLQSVWYSPASAPSGWSANEQAPAAAGGVYLSGYMTQHLWPQGDMPYQVLDSKTVVKESGPQKSSEFTAYGGTTATPPEEYPWNAELPIEGTFARPDDQRDAAQSIVPWTSSPSAPPAPWAAATPGNGPSAPGTVAHRFRINQYSNGALYGVRFYKAPGDGGAHVAYVWSESGALAAKADFTNETASGWQTAWLSTALPIPQFTSYLVGVSYSQGKWTETRGALGSGFASGSALELLADSASAPNGLTSTAIDGTAPATASAKTYFWVDPIVRADADRHALMYDRTTNLLYESYNVSRHTSGLAFPFDTSGQTTMWRAGGGAGIFDLLHGPLHPFGGVGGSTAGGLPVTPLILRYDELAKATTSGPGGGPGDVGHAIRMTSLGVMSMAAPPARNWAYNGRGDGMPYGARVRIKQSWLDAKTLDPSHSVTNYHVFDGHPQAQVVLNTLARYGAIMDDGGLMFQLSTSPVGADAWDADAMKMLFGNVHGDAFEIARIAAGYAIAGATNGQVGQPVSLTISLEPTGDTDADLYFWMTDGSDGAFSANPVRLAAGQSAVQVTYTPKSSGAKMLRALATTNAAGTTLSARFPPGGPAGLGPGFAITSLAQALDASSTTLTVAAAGNPYSSDWNLPFWVVIDDEIVKVTQVTGGVTWTVARADQPFGGVSKAAPHAAGAKVAMASTLTGTGPGYSANFFPWVLGPALTIAVP